MVVGWVSSSMPRTKGVPNSGTPRVPVVQSISSVVTPRASGEEKRLITFLSSSGMNGLNADRLAAPGNEPSSKRIFAKGNWPSNEPPLKCGMPPKSSRCGPKP